MVGNVLPDSSALFYNLDEAVSSETVDYLTTTQFFTPEAIASDPALADYYLSESCFTTDGTNYMYIDGLYYNAEGDVQISDSGMYYQSAQIPGLTQIGTTTTVASTSTIIAGLGTLGAFVTEPTQVENGVETGYNDTVNYFENL